VAFVYVFTLTQNKWKIDDVLASALARSVRYLVRLLPASLWQQGLGWSGRRRWAPTDWHGVGVVWAVLGGLLVYGVLKLTMVCA
jgi:Amt family ammonium transporter